MPQLTYENIAQCRYIINKQLIGDDISKYLPQNLKKVQEKRQMFNKRA